LGVWGFGFGVWGLGFGVWGLGFGVWGLVLGAHQGLGWKVTDGRGVLPVASYAGGSRACHAPAVRRPPHA